MWRRSAACRLTLRKPPSLPPKSPPFGMLLTPIQNPASALLAADSIFRPTCLAVASLPHRESTNAPVRLLPRLRLDSPAFRPPHLCRRRDADIQRDSEHEICRS